MIAVLLFIVWTAISLGVGLFLGRVLRIADEREIQQ